MENQQTEKQTTRPDGNRTENISASPIQRCYTFMRAEMYSHIHNSWRLTDTEKVQIMKKLKKSIQGFLYKYDDNSVKPEEASKAAEVEAEVKMEDFRQGFNEEGVENVK